MQIDGKEWTFILTRNMPFWIMYMGAEGNYRHAPDFGVNAHQQQMFININATQMHAFQEINLTTQYAQAVMEAVTSEKKIKKLKNNYKIISKQFINAFKQCKKNFNTQTWRKFQEEDIHFSAGLLITVALGRTGVSKLIELLEKKGFDENKVNQLVSVITYPKEHTPLFKSQLDLLKIGALVQEKKVSEQETLKLLKSWVRKHGFIPVNFCDQAWTLQDAKTQLESVLKNDCAKEILGLQKEHEKKVSEAKQALKQIKSREITVLAHALAEGTYLNEFRKNVFSKVYLSCRPLLKKIAKKAGSKDYRDCYYCTPQELNDIMEGKPIDLRKLVAQRQLIGCKREEDGLLHFMEKPLLDKILEFVQTTVGKTAVDGEVLEKQVKGMIGNKGKIVAKAKIVLNSRDFHKVSEGDIIVTTMTSVDFVPVMKIAGGFITNEGGITCHAAIVAREMNKPCLIGTKNATSVFKDGDKIELDADNGVVRIIG